VSASRRILFVLAGLAAAAVVAGTAIRPTAAQAPGTVAIHAAVEAPNGVPLEGLTGQDFEIVSGGIPQPFTLAAAAPLPIDTLLVADLTSSVTGRLRGVWATPWPEAFSLAADRLITDLRPGDRARVMAMIGPRFVASPVWSGDRVTLQRALRVFTIPDAPVEPSPLWDAVDEALTLFPPDARRRAIVVVTDGRATGNRAPLADVTERAMLAGIAVSIVELNPPTRSLGVPHSELTPGPMALLERLTTASGGVHRLVIPDARGTHNTRTAVGQILDLMRTSYVLTFVPPAAGPAVRPIDVRVKRPGVTVRARQGYGIGTSVKF
jgi:Ca-activated chloride channel family protein